MPCERHCEEDEKTAANQKNIFAWPIHHKVRVCRIYEELLELGGKKEEKNPTTKWAKKFQKRGYLMVHEKMFSIINH